jgi:molybdopterin converting factor small subunit
LVRVTIRLYGELRSRDSNTNTVILAVNENTKIIELFKKLKLSQEEVFVTLVNGQAHNFEQVLVEGDEVDIFPSLIGG